MTDGNGNGNGFATIIKALISIGAIVLSAVIIQMYQTVNETQIDVAIIKQQQENAIINEMKQDDEIDELKDMVEKYHSMGK